MNLKLQLQYLFNYFGLDIKSYNLKNNFNFRLKHFLDYKEIDCVIDIGANDGQFGKNLRKIGYKEQIISFEPIVTAYRSLEDTSKKDKKWKTFNFALGENTEEAEINISQNSLSSSILDMKKEHLNSAPTSKYVNREKISVKTLDSFKEEICKNFKNIYIKIDTQGYEEKVLIGGKDLVTQAKGLQLEMSVYPMYEDQLLFNEFFTKIEKLNFELWDIERTFSNPKSGKILQIDAIFFKKN